MALDLSKFQEELEALLAQHKVPAMVFLMKNEETLDIWSYATSQEDVKVITGLHQWLTGHMEEMQKAANLP